MEIHVVFTHKLVKVNVSGIEPPLFPLWRVAGCNTRVTDWRVKLEWLRLRLPLLGKMFTYPHICLKKTTLIKP